jgi:hypothetical protein
MHDGNCTTEHAEEKDARTPHIAALVVACGSPLSDLSDDDLRGNKSRRAAHGAHEVAIKVDYLAETEVRQLHWRVICRRRVEDLPAAGES